MNIQKAESKLAKEIPMLTAKRKVEDGYTKRALVVAGIADVAAIREETFQGKDFLVVPVIALVEGVHQASNAPAPELALASEFGKYPQGWDGRPVLLSHPQREGSPVSANSPEVLEDQSFEQI